jgi:hypothetical protein
LGDHPAALDWAREIAGFAPRTLAYSKRALNDLLEPPVDETSLRELFDAVWAARE